MSQNMAVVDDQCGVTLPLPNHHIKPGFLAMRKAGTMNFYVSNE